MASEPSCHSVCRWTFHAGKGGFVPPDAIPEWDAGALDTPACVELVAREIKPRLPDHIRLGMEFHYDYEVDEKNAAEVADALAAHGIHLALFTPGAHRHFAYGGIASLDAGERKAAEEFGERALELAQEDAGGRDIRISGGADVIQQYLNLGVIDELEIALVPVLFGGGRRLFENLRDPGPQLRIDRVINDPAATHLRYVRQEHRA